MPAAGNLWLRNSGTEHSILDTSGILLLLKTNAFPLFLSQKLIPFVLSSTHTHTYSLSTLKDTSEFRDSSSNIYDKE